MSEANVEISHENVKIISNLSYVENIAQIEHTIHNEKESVSNLSVTPITLLPVIQLVVNSNANISSIGENTSVSNVSTTISNVTTEGITSFVVATLPSSLVNGALSDIDSIIANAKATLDADILAAQTKAKNTVAASVATARSVIAEIENWLASAPGNIQVVESSITNVGVSASNIVTSSNGFIKTAKNDINIIGSDINSIESNINKAANIIVTDTEDVISVPVKIAKSIESDTSTVVHDSENVFGKIKTFWDKL